MSLSSNFKVGDYEHPETIKAWNEMSEGFLKISFGTTVPDPPVNFSEEVSVRSPGGAEVGRQSGIVFDSCLDNKLYE